MNVYSQWKQLQLSSSIMSMFVAPPFQSEGFLQIYAGVVDISIRDCDTGRKMKQFVLTDDRVIEIILIFMQGKKSMSKPSILN